MSRVWGQVEHCTCPSIDASADDASDTDLPNHGDVAAGRNLLVTVAGRRLPIQRGATAVRPTTRAREGANRGAVTRKEVEMIDGPAQLSCQTTRLS